MKYLHPDSLRPSGQSHRIRSKQLRLVSSTLFLASLVCAAAASAALGALSVVQAQTSGQGDAKTTPHPLSLNPATAASAVVADLTPPLEGTKVLLVTGIDYPGHHWLQTSPVLRDLLEQDPRLKVRIVSDPKVLASPALQQWDTVIIHFMDWEVPGPGPEARENLKRFVEQGKGLMLTHFGCGAWDNNEWPEFRNLAGRIWDPKRRPHDARGPFLVEIADPEHPITKGMQPFETNDELYTCLAGEAPIHVLAQARSKVDAKEYPMAFILRYGQGRVFHCVLGHDPLAYTNNPAVGELMRRGCAWAAGVEPLPRQQGQ